MIVSQKIKKIYEDIQKKIFYMIPEKWDKMYLYASIIDRNQELQTGEMYFYYYPKGVFKKNPINVYEIPNRFNIEEDSYLKLVNELYNDIKILRKELADIGEPLWSNITISIENATFKIQYEYDDLTISELNNYYRHLLWRYKYLNIPLSTYNKKDQVVLAKYIAKQTVIHKKVNVHTEGIYKEIGRNIIEYNKEENIIVQENKEASETKIDNKNIKSQILKNYNN